MRQFFLIFRGFLRVDIWECQSSNYIHLLSSVSLPDDEIAETSRVLCNFIYLTKSKLPLGSLASANAFFLVLVWMCIRARVEVSVSWFSFSLEDRTRLLEAGDERSTHSSSEQESV